MCYLLLASTGRNQSTAWTNDVPEGSRTNSIADLFIEPGIPACRPLIHLRSLAVSLFSESLLNYKWGGRKTARVNIRSRSSDCPWGTAPFLHLLECHYCILKPQLSITEWGRGTDNTKSQIAASILSNVALKCSDIQKLGSAQRPPDQGLGV